MKKNGSPQDKAVEEQDGPHCHELKVAHRVCKNCGYYDGKEVIAEKEESK